MNPGILLLSTAAAITFGLVLTPLVRHLALRWRLTDNPDGHRKLQQAPIPLGGGVSVLLALCGGIVVAILLERDQLEIARPARLQSLVGLLVASCAIVLLGLVDDRIGLRGRHKLFGQIAIVTGLVNCGYLITGVQLFGVQIELGILSIPISMGWLLLAINSLNLIDGVDGLASTVGIILSSTLACLALLTGHQAEALILACLAGALTGFLRYNFPPARIYLGDAGSMLIGLVLGAVSVLGALKGPTAVALAAPMAVWAVPLFDTFAAIARRKLTGRSIYASDRGHLHHCLHEISGSARRTLYLIVLACVATCIGAIASIALKSDLFAFISIGSVVGVLLATRSFGYGEFQLIVMKIRRFAQSLVPFQAAPPKHVRHAGISFQGSQAWDTLWQQMMELADELRLTQLSLDVNIPAVHENYHAAWRRPEPREPVPQWAVEIPLCSHGQRSGRILLAGPHDGFSVCVLLCKVMDRLEPLETQFQETVGGLAAVSRPAPPNLVRESGLGESTGAFTTTAS